MKELEENFKSCLILELQLRKAIETLIEVKSLSPKVDPLITRMRRFLKLIFNVVQFLDEKVDVSEIYEKKLTEMRQDLDKSAQDAIKKDSRLKEFRQKVWVHIYIYMKYFFP